MTMLSPCVPKTKERGVFRETEISKGFLEGIDRCLLWLWLWLCECCVCSIVRSCGLYWQTADRGARTLLESDGFHSYVGKRHMARPEPSTQRKGPFSFSQSPWWVLFSIHPCVGWWACLFCLGVLAHPPPINDVTREKSLGSCWAQRLCSKSASLEALCTCIWLVCVTA